VNNKGFYILLLEVLGINYSPIRHGGVMGNVLLVFPQGIFCGVRRANSTGSECHV